MTAPVTSGTSAPETVPVPLEVNSIEFLELDGDRFTRASQFHRDTKSLPPQRRSRFLRFRPAESTVDTNSINSRHFERRALIGRTMGRARSELGSQSAADPARGDSPDGHCAAVRCSSTPKPAAEITRRASRSHASFSRSRMSIYRKVQILKCQYRSSRRC
jgi:hypothetical protein